MRQGEAAFVDSGAWIALAFSRDPLQARARDYWDMLQELSARLHTSVPVVIETSPPGAQCTSRRPRLVTFDPHFAAVGLRLVG
jgi:predicted nucleic acid-binding protein